MSFNRREFERASSITVENKKASSAKSFGLECKLSVKSLLHTRKSSGPRMEPLGTTVLMSAYEECWPFKTSLFFLLLRKSVKKSQQIPSKTMLAFIIYKSFVPVFVKNFRDIRIFLKPSIPSSKEGKIS